VVFSHQTRGTCGQTGSTIGMRRSAWWALLYVWSCQGQVISVTPDEAPQQIDMLSLMLAKMVSIAYVMGFDDGTSLRVMLCLTFPT
jgi:hypothetical protein